VTSTDFGLNVVYYDIIRKLPLGNATALNSLDELLETSDFVTLHVPATKETKEMIGAEQLRKMKSGSYLLNLSRGSVVVIPDLVAALKDEHIAGASVDVFPVEPPSTKVEFVSELRGLPNVILTPHIGGSTEEAQAAIGREVAESLINFLTEGITVGSVNFPNVHLPKHEGVHRMLNVHRNQPGVLSSINQIVSESGANISAQYLSTDPNIGYMVMDISKEKNAVTVAERLKELDSSIKTRLLY
jgi:D-3-phosphoglycerate dehydrogenase